MLTLPPPLFMLPDTLTLHLRCIHVDVVMHNCTNPILRKEIPAWAGVGVLISKIFLQRTPSVHASLP